MLSEFIEFFVKIVEFFAKLLSFVYNYCDFVEFYCILLRVLLIFSQGYKKIVEKDVDLQYFLPNLLKFQLSKAYADCYEILDAIFNKTLGFYYIFLEFS